MRLFIILFFSISPALSAAPLPDYPFVYVYGTATREVAPDSATIGFSIKCYDEKAERAYRQQAKTADTVISFAEKLGIAPEKIVAQAIEKSAIRRTDERGTQYEVLGYDTVRIVRIEVGNLAHFPKLIDFLYDQPFIERISADFGRTDFQNLQVSLTKDACRAAQENAGRLSEGFGKKLGSVRAISESEFAGIGAAFGFPAGRGGGFDAQNRNALRDFRVIPATISFQRGIFAIFAIE